jgi:hypothetical protein
MRTGIIDLILEASTWECKLPICIRVDGSDLEVTYDPGVFGGVGKGKAGTVLGCAGGLEGTYDLVRNFRRGFLVLGCRLVLHCLSALAEMSESME